MKRYKKGPRFGPNSHQKMLYKQFIEASEQLAVTQEVKNNENVESEKAEVVTHEVQQSQPKQEVEEKPQKDQKVVDQITDAVTTDKLTEKKKK